MKIRTVLLGLFFFSLGEIALLPRPSFGQTYQTFRSEINRINETARLRLGPFRVFPSLSISDIGYDDNVYRRSKSLEPIGDYTATLGVRADFHFIYRNWLLFTFTENPSYLYFVEQDHERHLNNTYAFTLRALAFGRLALSGTHQFSNQRTFLSSEIEARVILKTTVYGGTVFFETPRNTSFGLTGSIRKLKYEDTTVPGSVLPVSINLDREERSGGGEFYYRVFSDSFIFATFDYLEYNFEYPQSKFRDSYAYRLSSGLRFPLFGRARGILSLGFRTLVPRMAQREGYSGFVGNTSVSLRLGRFDLRFAYSRDIQFSLLSDSIYFLQDRYGAGLSFYLNPFIRLDYNYSRGENSYPTSQLVALPEGGLVPIKRKDIIEIQSAAIVFRIIRKTGIGLRTDYWQRQSNYPGASFSRLFYGGFLTYEF